MAAAVFRGPACGLWLVLTATCLPAEPELTRFEFRETHMGSPFKLILYCTDAATARRCSRAAFDRIARLDAALSDYEPTSELMRLCDRAGGPPVPVSEDLFRVLQGSLEMSRRSGGAFDATVNPVVRLWRRAQRDRRLPDPALLAKARALVGSGKVRLDPEARTVQLLQPGMKLDLGGIAKGFAAGEAIAELKRQGIDRALVAGAGDIVVGGSPPDTEGWTIGIAPLETPDSVPSRFLLLHDAAVSTSGDAERFVEIGGVRYSHIVDPRTGLGLTGRSSVTIVARDGMTCDSLATAVSVLGPERGLALVEETPGAAALIVLKTDAGTRAIESERFRALPAATPKPARTSEPASESCP
jgi:thiamine biosynthesis lipoprotein